VTPSAATGAAVEPLRSTHSAARLRAWRVVGVAIWPDQRAAPPIRTGLFAKRAVARCARKLPAIPDHGGPQSCVRRALNWLNAHAWGSAKTTT